MLAASSPAGPLSGSIIRVASDPPIISDTYYSSLSQQVHEALTTMARDRIDLPSSLSLCPPVVKIYYRPVFTLLAKLLDRIPFLFILYLSR